MKRKIQEKQDEIARFDSQYYFKLTQKGMLESEKKYHEKAIKEREELIRDMSTRLAIKGYNAEGLSEDQIRQFTDRVEENLKKMRKDWEALKEKNTVEESAKSARYQDLRSTLRAKEGSRDSQNDNLKRFKSRVKTMQQELDGMVITSLDVQTAEKDYADLIKQGEDMAAAQAEANYDGKIREKNDAIRKMDEQREDVTGELNILNRQADFRAKLDMKRKSAEQKKGEADALLDRHSEALTQATGKIVTGLEAERQVNEAISAKEKELANKERAEQESNKRLQHTESTLTFARKQLKEKETQANVIDKEIQQALDGEFKQLDEAIQDAEREAKICREELSLMQNATNFFERALKQGNDKHSCVACGRSIEEDEKNKVLEHMKEMIRKSQPEMQAEEKDNLEIWESQLRKYSDLKPKESQMMIIQRDEIPGLRVQVQQAEEQLNELREKAEQTTNDVDEVKSELRELNNLRRIAADIARMLKEVDNLQSEAKSLEKDLVSTGTARTGDEVQEEIDTLANGIKTLKRELQMLQQDKETIRTQLSSHERSVHRVEMTLTQKRQDFSRRQEMQNRLEELQKEQEETQQTLNNLQRQMEASSEPIRKAREDLDNFKRDATKVESEAQSKLDHLSGLVKQLQACETDVQR